jgi:hypothetical protein
MAQIAKTFGRFFGPKGKMPNPKAGCVVPPNANLEQVSGRLNKTVKLQAKQKPLLQMFVAQEDMDDAKIVENIMSIHKALVHKLPGEESNIRSCYMKFTMGPTVKVGQLPTAEEKTAKPEAKAAQSGVDETAEVENKNEKVKAPAKPKAKVSAKETPKAEAPKQDKAEEVEQ